MTPTREGFIPVTGGRVFYRMLGEGNRTPLVLLHGGPGSSHGYFVTLEALANERPVVFYDQLGCGRSDRPEDPSLWTIERYARELQQLREALGLDEIHLLGHSWGAVLALDYVLGGASGVRSLVLSSPVLSASRWAADADRLRATLPPDVEATLRSHEAGGTTDTDEYRAAEREFYKRFVCRLDPWPQALLDVIAGSNRAIYRQMWGSNEFSPSGTLRNYERLERLPELAIPTLLACGRYDESTPETLTEALTRTPKAEMVVWQNSAHMGPLEEPERYVAVVREFMSRFDTL